jgi:hypothetical protein
MDAFAVVKIYEKLKEEIGYQLISYYSCLEN